MLPTTLALLTRHLHAQEASLQEEKHIFHEVAAVLDEMVGDVESWHYESEIFTLKREIGLLKTEIEQFESRQKELVQERQRAYEHAHLVEQQGRQLAHKLEENLKEFVSELVAKDILEKELRDARQQLLTSAEVSQQLAKAQRDIRELQRKQSIQKLLKGYGYNYGHGHGNMRPPLRSPSHTNKQPIRPMGVSASAPTLSQDTSTRSLSDNNDNDTDQESLSSIAKSHRSGERHFWTIPERLLMQMLSFLDAKSVFAMSLTNRFLRMRIHGIFGLPLPVEKSPGKHVRINSAPSFSPSSSSSSPTPPSPASTSPASSSSLNESSASSFLSSSIASVVASNSSSRLPLFSKSKSMTGLLSSTSNNSKVVDSKSSASQQQLSRAEKIVQSLNKNEMKLFHEMSTHVKYLESSIATISTEKEDLMARLMGAENVRDFLMDKLKELEENFAKMIEEQHRKDEQTLFDREIIGFLDARTHDYEQALSKLQNENGTLAEEIERMKEEHQAKATIVEDMIQLLTDEKKDLELQLKTQRKVLVREVKVLRAQNQQLLTEKQQLGAQLKQLKQALHHLNEVSFEG